MIPAYHQTQPPHKQLKRHDKQLYMLPLDQDLSLLVDILQLVRFERTSIEKRSKRQTSWCKCQLRLVSPVNFTSTSAPEQHQTQNKRTVDLDLPPYKEFLTKAQQFSFKCLFQSFIRNLRSSIYIASENCPL